MAKLLLSSQERNAATRQERIYRTFLTACKAVGLPVSSNLSHLIAWHRNDVQRCDSDDLLLKKFREALKKAELHDHSSLATLITWHRHDAVRKMVGGHTPTMKTLIDFHRADATRQVLIALSRARMYNGISDDFLDAYLGEPDSEFAKRESPS